MIKNNNTHNIISLKKENFDILMLLKKHKESLYWHIRKIVISHEYTDYILFSCIEQVYKEEGFIDRLRLFKLATEKSLEFIKEKKEFRFPNSNISTETLLLNLLENDSLFKASKAQAELYKASLLLTENQRLIFNMKYFDHMNYNDISQILEQSEESCKRIFSGAYNTIEAILKLY